MEINSLVGDRFRIKDKIGSGGQGDVYKTEDITDQNRLVAIKIFKEDAWPGENYLTRIRNEVAALKSIQSNNVIEIIASSEIDASNSSEFPLYIVTTLAKYGNLEEHNYYQGEIDLSLRLFRKVCSGVADIHKQKIVHRDLKPSNILLVDSEKDLRVADFGICFIGLEDDRERATKIRQKVGAYSFAAPEQTSLPPTYNNKGDIYSLGRILHYMITGEYEHTPGQELSLISVSLGMKEQHPVDSLVAKMCNFDPKNRPESVADVIAEIDELLGISNSSTDELVLTKTQLRILKYLGSPSEGEATFEEILDYMANFTGVTRENNSPTLNFFPFGSNMSWSSFVHAIESALDQLEEGGYVRFRRGFYSSLEH